jgi:hypothetical protein
MKQAFQIILLAVAVIAIPWSAPIAIFFVFFANPFTNSAPPPIAEGQITPEDWTHWDEAGRKFTAVLARRFPSGSNEATLKSTLLAQDFHFPKPPPTNCLPPGQEAPIGVVYYRCLTSDAMKALERTLVYEWGRFPCTKSLSVQWSAGDRGEITNVRGSYYGVCL